MTTAQNTTTFRDTPRGIVATRGKRELHMQETIGDWFSMLLGELELARG